MKVFILEDNPKRVDKIKALLPNAVFHHSQDTKVTISILEQQKFDVIFLDHDLTEITDWKSEGTGYEVAKYLGKRKTPNDNSIIIVHSMNPEGSEQMIKVLKTRKALKIPYVELLNLDLKATLKLT